MGNHAKMGSAIPLRLVCTAVLTGVCLYAQPNNPCNVLRPISRWHARVSGSIKGKLVDRGVTTTYNQSGAFSIDFSIRQSEIDPFGDDLNFFGNSVGSASIDNSIVSDRSAQTTSFFGAAKYEYDKTTLDGVALSFQAGPNGVCSYFMQFATKIDGVLFTSHNKENGEHNKFTGQWEWFLLALAPIPDNRIDSETLFIPPLIIGTMPVPEVPDAPIKVVTRRAVFSRMYGGIPFTAELEWSLAPGPPEDLDEEAIKVSLSQVAPDSDGRTFVTNSGHLPNAKCLFRSQGPIRYSIGVTRHLGELNPDGTLKYAKELVDAGRLSPKAKLVMPAYDVDSAAVGTQTRRPERDKVLFNGVEIGQLTGTNEAWTLNTFEVDINKVRFAPRAAVGSEPQPAENEVVIQIDTENPEAIREPWCTAIGWGSLSFKATSPIILVHGNNGESRGFSQFFRTRGFTDALDEAHLPYDLSVRLSTGSIAVNGTALTKQIPNIVKSFGADSAHIIAHSKGGLDSRDYLAVYRQEKPRTVSLTTLDTPHLGSVGAEVLTLAKNFIPTWFIGPLGTLQTVAAFAAGQLGGYNAGLPYVTPGAIASWSETNLPNLPRDISYYTAAGDADQNGNAIIDIPSEWEALRPDVPSARVADLVYQLFRNYTNIVVAPNPLTGGLVRIALPISQPLGNDVAVQLPSARGDGDFARLVTQTLPFEGPEGRNHASIVDDGVARKVIPLLKRADEIWGDLR